MPNRFRIHVRRGLRAVVVALTTSLALSGCIGGCIQLPPVSFEVTLASNVALPPLGAPAGFPIDNVTVTLSQGACNLPSTEQIRAQVQAAVGSFLADRIRLESATIDSVSLVAKQGDFNDLKALSLGLVVSPNVISVGQVSNAAGLGSRIDLVPPAPVEMLDLLDQASNGCLNLQATVDGSVPSQTIAFDVKAKFSVTVALGK